MINYLAPLCFFVDLLNLRQVLLGVGYHLGRRPGSQQLGDLAGLSLPVYFHALQEQLMFARGPLVFVDHCVLRLRRHLEGGIVFRVLNGERVLRLFLIVEVYL